MFKFQYMHVLSIYLQLLSMFVVLPRCYTMGTTKKDTATRGGHNPRGVYVFQYVPFPLLRE